MPENTSPPEPTILEELTAARDRCVEVVAYLKTGQSRQSRGLDVEPYDQFNRLTPARNALADIGRHMSQLCASRRLPKEDLSYVLMLIDTCTADRFRFHGFGDFLTIAIHLESWLVIKVANLANPAESPAAALQEAAAGAPPPERATRGMSIKEADIKARELAADPKRRFFVQSDRRKAKMIGCSYATWKKTSFYPEATQNKKKRVENKSAGTDAPKVVSFTTELQHQVGEGSRGQVLEQLIAEQEADAEPSPLADDPMDHKPRKVYSRKQV